MPSPSRLARRASRRQFLAAGILLTGIASASFLAGCQGGACGSLLESADQFVNTTVGPEYLEYVQADPSLTEGQKQIRRDNVQTFRDAVAAGLNPSPG